MAYELEKLPVELQDRLARAGRGEDLEECPAMPLEGTVGKWILTVLGLVFGLAPCVYILDYRSMLPFDETSGCFVTSFLGMWMLSSGIGRLRRYKAAKVKPVAVLGRNDLMVYEERGGLVDVTRLADIVGIVITRNHLVRVNRKERPALVLVPGTNSDIFFQELQRRRAQAMEQPVAEGGPGDWYGAAERAGASPSMAWNRPWQWGLHFRVLATGLLATCVVIFSAWRQVGMYVAVTRFEDARAEDSVESWQRWLKSAMRASEVLAPHDRLPLSVKGKWPYGRDFTHWMLWSTPFAANLEVALTRYEELSWEEARAENSPEVLRGYLGDFPTPAHLEEAEAALRKLYAAAEARYMEGATSVPAGAREGMRALLHSLAADHVMTEKLGVSFLPVAGVEGGAIEAAVKASTGAKVVYPVGPSFTQEANEGRHTKIVSSLNSGFRRVVADLFELEERPLDAAGPRVLVGYEVQFSGDHFFSKSQASLPMNERELYVGIQVLFTCSIQVPAPGEVASQDPEEGHPVRILARPAPDFRVSGSRYSSMQRMVYDRMAETAFEEFSSKIAATYGIGALSGSPPPGKTSP
jgi:hypothetical protein